jgi:hypothetical protein
MENCKMAKANGSQKGKGLGVKRPRIDREKFIDTWMDAAEQGHTMAWVAETLGCSLGGVYQKAKVLIEDGVTLPTLSNRRRVKIDVDSVNEKIKARLKKAGIEATTMTVTPRAKKDGDAPVPKPKKVTA